MALVKAPNGDVYDLSDSVASGLIGGKNGWSAVKTASATRGGKGKAEVVADKEGTEAVEPVEVIADEEANN